MKNRIQALVTAIMGTLSSLLGVLFVPVLLLVACNIIDYATGLMAAPYRKDGKISSYKSFRGNLKEDINVDSCNRRISDGSDGNVYGKHVRLEEPSELFNRLPCRNLACMQRDHQHFRERAGRRPAVAKMDASTG